ncbi:stromal cell-derived factor 2-like [Penaeus monodon]|uniref:stromal cell-derived factor 2-like n=1 Tax=Penaeus monodon TaxID=6687 RepID=UPI0018A7B38A|nr:stromal cell-derived factor 2-like [Penaeus monodon]
MRLYLAFVLSSFVCCINGTGIQQVTCGSVVKLYNSYYKVRLHSHDVKYGSGSGQQSVTGTQQQDDHNSNWLIKGTPKRSCKRGTPISCGQQVRLEHLATKKNLHSHHFSSPLSDQQEISAFGSDGEGDSGDEWLVICDGEEWGRDQYIMFRHIDTDVYLGVTGQQYGRPIHGQNEVVGLSRPGVQAKWQTMEGVFIKSTDFSEDVRVFHDPSEL